jgi:sulfide:quinone oxidoreductase
MEPWIDDSERRPRVVIAGGGVAALEACLFLREYVTAEEVAVVLLTPARHFSYRPLSVLESFGDTRTWTMPLDRFADDCDATLVHDALAQARPGERTIETADGARHPYDLLLVAIGGTPVVHIPGALTFHGPTDAPAVRRVLDDAAAHRCSHIVFAANAGASWPIPLYELALLASATLHDRGSRPRLTFVTPESGPLEAFGSPASELVAALLQEHGIALMTNAEALSASDRELRLADGRTVEADRVIALPRVVGRFVDGLPQDTAGFVPVDPHGRVPGLDAVYAAGDITTFPYKQGGLATQQADAAAEAILADLGLPIEPRPFSPVLQGMLYTGGTPAYLRRPLGGDQAPGSDPRSYSLWWPPSKIAGRFLSPYLTVRAGAPRTPEVRPSSDLAPVRRDVMDAIARGAGPVPADG